MTLNDFNDLSYQDQVHYWLDEGRCIAARFIGSYSVKLYAVDRFFVEIWHNADFNQIERLVSFSSGPPLEVYLMAIKLML